MLRLIVYTVFLCVGCLSGCGNNAQASAFRDAPAYAANDSGGIQHMLDIARNRLNASARKKSDLDTAYYYTVKALRLSQSMHSPTWQAECLQVLAAFYYEQGNMRSGRENLLAAWLAAKKAGSLESQVKCLHSMSNYVCGDSTLYPVMLGARDQLIDQFKKPVDKQLMFDSINAIVTDLAEIGFKGFQNQSMRTFQDADVYAMALGEKSPRIALEPYFNLFYYNFYQGNLTKAFYYALEAVKITDKGLGETESQNVGAPYSNMGFMYFAVNNTDQSIIYYRKAMAVLRKNGLAIEGRLLKAMTKALLKAGKPEEALAMLQEKNPGKLSTDDANESEVLVDDCMGMCYQALKEYQKAEGFYLQSLEKGKAQGKEKVIAANFLLSNLYIEWGRFQKAKNCLAVLLADSNLPMVALPTLSSIHFLLFKVDTAEKNYLSAIKELDLYKTLNDSVFNATKNKQIEELKVQYETEKREKDIQLLTKQNNLQASQIRQQTLASAYEGEVRKREMDRVTYEANKKDAELKLADFEAQEKDKNLLLKEQSIELLLKQKELQQAALSQTRFFRNVFIAGMILLVALLGLLLNRYLIKQKSNRLLEAQREVIYRSNTELRQLNNEQENLLTQKEWLVREIHHRVKNNLQIIISLLNAQLDFLDNNPQALRAIQNSRERMHAIALIHQKLYERDGNSAIDMYSYIRELITHLGAGFFASGNVQFCLDIAHIKLDISQAVPLGLIMNEAITNAIKYAFPGNRTGTIRVSLQNIPDQEVQLMISDDGKGYSEKALAAGKNSLGLELIELFAEQLGASLHRITDAGVSITLVFKQMITPTVANS
jgi:two-component sensor histidine kinase